MVDLGILTTANALGPNKIMSGRKRVGKKLDHILKERLSKNINVIGFDEKLDTTLLHTSKESGILTENDCFASTTISYLRDKEEHCPILGFGSIEIHGKEGSYLTHVTPIAGDAEALSQEIYNTIEMFNAKESVIGILADGCNKNTGIHAGVIRKLEEKLEKPLAHLICLYHTNELPFRYDCYRLDDRQL